MDMFAKKLLASLMAIAMIVAVVTGLVMTGTASAQPPACPLDEDFSSWLPSGWTTDDWSLSNSTLAGGTAPEAEVYWMYVSGNYSYLDSKPVDTSGMLSLTLEFKSHIDHYTGGFDCRVYTRAHGGDGWTEVTPWYNPIMSNLPANDYTVDISSDIGTATQVRFEFNGYYWNLDWWDVDDVKICGVVGPTLPYHLKYLHAEDGLFNLTEPVDKQWHELWPFFSKEYHLSSWNDTSGDGVLSYCDWIDMYEKPDGAVKPYHVEDVTITLNVTLERVVFIVIDDLVENGPGNFLFSESMYIEHKGGYDPAVLAAPNSTQWHEIYPEFCTEYRLIYREDHCATGLSSSDLIWLEDKETGWITEWYVEEVAIDIVVTPEPPPVGGEAYPVSKASFLAPWIALGVVLAGGISWYVLRRRRAQS